MVKAADVNFPTGCSELNTYYDRHNIDLIDVASFAGTRFEANAVTEKMNFNVLLVTPPDNPDNFASLPSGGSVTCDSDVEEACITGPPLFVKYDGGGHST